MIQFPLFKKKSNQFQTIWLLKKEEFIEQSGACCAQEAYASLGDENLQRGLDLTRFTQLTLSKLEYLYGESHIGTGGEEMIKKIGQVLDLQSGTHILDIGSGPGGGAFTFAKV